MRDEETQAPNSKWPTWDDAAESQADLGTEVNLLTGFWVSALPLLAEKVLEARLCLQLWLQRN